MKEVTVWHRWEGETRIEVPDEIAEEDPMDWPFQYLNQIHSGNTTLVTWETRDVKETEE